MGVHFCNSIRMIKITLLLALSIVAISSHDDKDSKQGCADGSSPLCTDESVANDDGLCSDGSEPACAPEIEIVYQSLRRGTSRGRRRKSRRRPKRPKLPDWLWRQIGRSRGKRSSRGRHNDCMPNGGFCCFRNVRAPTPFAGPCAFGSCVFSRRECKSRKGPKSYHV